MGGDLPGLSGNNNISTSFFDQAENLNNTQFYNLTSNLQDATSHINQMLSQPEAPYLNNTVNYVLPNGELGSSNVRAELNKIKSDISGSINNIATTQLQTLDYLNSFKDFAVSNEINKELTSKYAQNQLNNTNIITDNVKQDNSNKLRMVEINEYYIKKNHLINKIIKNILILLAILLIIIILAKKDILPTNIAYFFGSIIIICIIIYLIYNTLDIRNRDK